MRWVKSNGDVIAVAMFLAKRLSELVQIEPVPEEMIEHRHAGGIMVLHDNDGHADIIMTNESGIIWSDREVNIEWPDASPELSQRDLELPTFAQYRQNPVRWE